MKQVIQYLRDGKLSLKDAPKPLAKPGHVVIANVASVISAGTEKGNIQLARKSLLGKARDRPDQVRRVLEKLRNEGFWETLSLVNRKLDEPSAMGYSSAGIALACGPGVKLLRPGDRIASNGAHAEVVSVPEHLCANIPDGVDFSHAAFAVIGAIALHGVRLSKVSLGETVLVIGLGLVGQITCALLKTAGARVLGVDPDEKKCELACAKMGADFAKTSLSSDEIMARSRGIGVDAVIITASAKSSEPIQSAAEAVRHKGRIVMVGVTGMELDRRPFYFKECEFLVSCSYGPGRYDPLYEELGFDYPPGHVRWTEQRNIQAVLEFMSRGLLDVGPLVSHRYPFEQALDAYDMIQESREPYLGVILEYPSPALPVSAPERFAQASRSSRREIRVGVVGAGNYARGVLLPKLKSIPEFVPKLVFSATGMHAAYVAEKYGFERAVNDEDEIFASPDIDAVFILTRHHLHAEQVIKAIRAGKHVFVEKPLALTIEELIGIEDALRETSEIPRIMVGFNRRFSPFARDTRMFMAHTGAPLTVSVRFNAGKLDPTHWTHIEHIGGGRIIGEACHGIDLASYIAGSRPTKVYADCVGGVHSGEITQDQCFLTLRHANGSVSSIAYLSGGDPGFPKERVEVFGGGKVAVIDDFRSLITSSGGKQKKTKLSGQDKGHADALKAFAASIMDGDDLLPDWDELRAVSLASILAVRSIREGVCFEIP